MATGQWADGGASSSAHSCAAVAFVPKPRICMLSPLASLQTSSHHWLFWPSELQPAQNSTAKTSTHSRVMASLFGMGMEDVLLSYSGSMPVAQERFFPDL